MVGVIEVAGRKIGPGHPCFIIAEAGVNHNGRVEAALELVDAAVRCGSDAVKFQTFKTEDGLTAEAPKAEYQLRTTGSQESQFDMVKRLELPEEAFRLLMDHSSKQGIQFLSTPFDLDSADLLARLGVDVYKIASGEIINLPLVSLVASKGKPMIVSTGMANLGEVESVVRTIKAAGGPGIVLLHCVSNYPADPADVNLAAMRTMSTAFGVPVGYSDHTQGIDVALAAVALGACVVEKHITLDRNLPGPDHQASLEPEEFAAMVRGIRTVEAALGHGRKEPAPSEANTAAVARKSLVAARDIAAGMTITDELIAIKRPGTGLPPSMATYVVGRTSRVLIPAGALIALEMLG